MCAVQFCEIKRKGALCKRLGSPTDFFSEIILTKVSGLNWLTRAMACSQPAAKGSFKQLPTTHDIKIIDANKAEEEY